MYSASFLPGIIILRFIHIEYINILFIVQFYSILWIYHNLLLHSPLHEHLGYLQLLSIYE